MTVEVLTGIVILGILIFLVFKRIGEKKDEKFDKRKWQKGAIWDIHNAIFSDRTLDIHPHDSELNENAHKNTRDYLIEASYALYKDMAIP